MTIVERNNHTNPQALESRTYGPETGSRETFASIIGSARAEGTASSAEKPESRDPDSAKKAGTGSKDTSDANRTREFQERNENEPISDRGFGSAALSATKGHGDLIVPPVRSILHVADLERLVALIRIERAGAMHSVTVNLKHSVFEGLEFRVSFEKGRGLSAEIFAGSESIRTALLERSQELVRLLAERGIDLGSLDVSLGGQSKENSRFLEPGKSADRPLKSITNAAEAVPDVSFESSTSYIS